MVPVLISQSFDKVVNEIDPNWYISLRIFLRRGWARIEKIFSSGNCSIFSAMYPDLQGLVEA